jgi:hypothetical protein
MQDEKRRFERNRAMLSVSTTSMRAAFLPLAILVLFCAVLRFHLRSEGQAVTASAVVSDLREVAVAKSNSEVVADHRLVKVSGSVRLEGDSDVDPLSNAMVQLISRSGEVKAQSDLDADGHFTLQVAHGEYFARVLADVSQTIALAPEDFTFARKTISQEAMIIAVDQDIANLELSVTVLISIKGIVQDTAGNRITNARVVVDPAPIDADIDTISNSKGEFAIAVPWSATVRAGRKDLGWSAVLEIENGAAVPDEDEQRQPAAPHVAILTFGNGCVFHGRAIAGGARAADLHGKVKEASGWQRDNADEFVVSALDARTNHAASIVEPDGSFVIGLERDQSKYVFYDGPPDQRSLAHRLRCGEQGEKRPLAPIELVLREQPLSLGGVIVTPSGKPVLSEFKVCIESGSCYVGNKTDERGAFAFYQLPAGIYTINGSTDLAGPFVAKISVPTTNAVIVSRGIAHVIGHANMPATAVKSIYVASACNDRSALHAGKEVIIGPNGRYEFDVPACAGRYHYMIGRGVSHVVNYVASAGDTLNDTLDLR